MSLTYAELAAQIAKMPADRTNDTVSILSSDLGEIYPIQEFGDVETVDTDGDIQGVLDHGHYIIKI